MRKRLAIFVAVFALLVQPMYALVASQVVSAIGSGDITTEQQLRDAAADTSITVLSIKADITVSSKINLSGRNVSIDGNGHTLTFTGDLEGWQGNYILQAYRNTVGIKNLSFAGGDAALLANGATVNLEGTIQLSDAEFGGIEVSQGSGVTTPAILNVGSASLTNTSEVYTKPTAWIINGQGTVNYAGFTAATHVKADQTQYYLNPTAALTAAPTNLVITRDGTTVDVTGTTVQYTSHTLRWSGVLNPNAVWNVRVTHPDGSENTSRRSGTANFDLNDATRHGHFGTQQGVYKYEVRQQQSGAPYAGVTDWSSPVYLTFDSVAPTVTFSSPSALVNTTKPFTISGSYNDAHSKVTRLHLYITANGNEYKGANNISSPNHYGAIVLGVNAQSGNFSYTLTQAQVNDMTSQLGISSGDSINIRAYAADELNNWSNTDRIITADTAAPKLTSLSLNKINPVGGVNYTSAKLNGGYLDVTFTTNEPLKLLGSQVGFQIPGFAGPPATGWTPVTLVDANTNTYKAHISLLHSTDWQNFFKDKTYSDMKLYIRTVDALGNYDSVYYYGNNTFGKSPWSAYKFTLDNQAPVASITAPAADGDVASGTIDITGKMDEANPDTHWFEIKGPNGYEYTTGAGHRNGTDTWTIQWDTTQVKDGTYTIRYVAADKAGNRNDDPSYTNSTTRTVIVDNGAPTVPSITKPTPRQWFNSANTTNSWTESTDNLSGIKGYEIKYEFEGRPAATRFETGLSRTQTFSGNYQGPITISVRAQDNAGNWSAFSNSVTYNYDSERPTTNIVAPTGFVGNTFTVSGTAKDNLGLNRVYVQLDKKEGGRFGGKTIHLITNPLSKESNWSHTYNAQALGLADGEYRAHVEVTDMAGNRGTAGWTDYFTVNNAAPQATVVVGSLATGDTTNDKNITITGTGTPAPFGTDIKTHFLELKTPGGATHYIYSDKTSNRCALDGANKCSFELTDYYDVDGEYKVRYVVTDQQGHRNDGHQQSWVNGTHQATFAFIVDSTAPTITINDSGATFNTATPTITGTVDADATKVEVSLDGGDSWQEAAYTADDTTWSYTVPAQANGQFTVLARATDAHGNTNSATSNPQQATGNFTIAVVTDDEEEVAYSTPETPTQPEGLEAQPVLSFFLPVTLGALGASDDATTPLLRTTPSTNSDDSDADVLGAEDVRTDWSVVNAALAGFIAILAVVALAGIRRTETDNNTGARVFMLVPAAAAVIAFFVIEDLTGSMIWFNVWTWLFAGILVVQAILATLTTRTAND
ncbi:hypothetical protein B7Y92_01195 [Candidatus Saccharibacteria bacterium 32-50-13]|nr:MAG: hypothetical protein B7Y92_01195 [Candidatus Saccharibacteria bacterium 32-50-13]